MVVSPIHTIILIDKSTRYVLSNFNTYCQIQNMFNSPNSNNGLNCGEVIAPIHAGQELRRYWNLGPYAWSKEECNSSTSLSQNLLAMPLSITLLSL